jgi:hypothetical protein
VLGAIGRGTKKNGARLGRQVVEAEAKGCLTLPTSSPRHRSSNSASELNLYWLEICDRGVR